MVSTVYMICDAYESGYGYGVQNSPKKNPMGLDGDEVSKMCHEAWDIGWDKGNERRKEVDETPSQPLVILGDIPTLHTEKDV